MLSVTSTSPLLLVNKVCLRGNSDRLSRFCNRTNKEKRAQGERGKKKVLMSQSLPV